MGKTISRIFSKSVRVIPTKSSPTGALNRGAAKKYGDFSPMSRYISEMIEDMDIDIGYWNANRESYVV